MREEGGVVGDRSAAQGCGVIALAVLNGIVVVAIGWIGVGNGDRLKVFDGFGECELSTVLPETATPVTALAVPSVVTVKAEAAAVVAESASL